MTHEIRGACVAQWGMVQRCSLNLIKIAEVQGLLLVTKPFRCGHAVGRAKLPVKKNQLGGNQEHLLGTYMSHKAFIRLVKQKMPFKNPWEYQPE